MVTKSNAARILAATGDEAPRRPPASKSRIGPVVGPAAVVESPARRLQLELEHNLGRVQAQRWSPRRTLAFVAMTNLVGWAALIWLVRALF